MPSACHGLPFDGRPRGLPVLFAARRRRAPSASFFFRSAARSAFVTSTAPMVVISSAVRVSIVRPSRRASLSAVGMRGLATMRSASSFALSAGINGVKRRHHATMAAILSAILR